MRDRSLLVGSLTVVVAAAGFGLLGPLARFAYDTGLEPIPFVAWRAAFATLIVVTFAAWRIRGGRAFVAPWRIATSERVALGVAVVCGFTLNLGMFLAFDRMSVAVALLAFYTYPAMVAAVEIALGREPLDAVRETALGLSLGGMVLVVAGGLTGGGEVRVDGIGVALALMAALSQTVFVTISRHGYASVPTEQAMAWIVSGMMVSYTLLALLGGGVAALSLPLADPTAFALVAVAGTISAGIPSLLFLSGIRSIGGTRAGVLMLFEPVVGVALAAVLLGETITPLQGLGGVAVLLAAVVLQRSASPLDVPGRNASALAGGIER
jgi:drug/metabolite transporter (DMT)-like permease